MMLHLGFELVSHQLDCIPNDSWLRCHVLFLITPVWGTLFFPFHISKWLLDLKSFAFASVASSPKLSSAPFAAKKALQFSHWPCVRGSQVGWDDDGWDFLKESISTPNTLQKKRTTTFVTGAIRGNRGFHRDLFDAGWLTVTPPKPRGV